MNKAELVVQIAEKANLTKANAERVLNVFLQTVEEALVNEGKLTLTGFGSFVVEVRKGRVGRNPQTGAEVDIPAANVVKFRPSKLLAGDVRAGSGTGGGGPRIKKD